MFYVYVLSSLKRNYLYVGLSNDFERRLKEHQNGQNVKTKAYRPFKVLYVEKQNTRQEARSRERYLKSGCGKEWIKINFV